MYSFLSFVKAIDVQSILNIELDPKVKLIPLHSPNFTIPGTADIPEKTISPQPMNSPSSPSLPVSPPSITEETNQEPPSTLQQADNILTVLESDSQEMISNAEDVSTNEDDSVSVAAKDKNKSETTASNRFYTPDEEEIEEAVEESEPVFEESESVSYVPPFNNPVYPNDNFTSYTSTIGKW